MIKSHNLSIFMMEKLKDLPSVQLARSVHNSFIMIQKQRYTHVGMHIIYIAKKS